MWQFSNEHLFSSKPFHKPAKNVIGRKPSFVVVKECVKNQVFGGENANLLAPKALELEEPELHFNGYGKNKNVLIQ